MRTIRRQSLCKSRVGNRVAGCGQGARRRLAGAPATDQASGGVCGRDSEQGNRLQDRRTSRRAGGERQDECGRRGGGCSGPSASTGRSRPKKGGCCIAFKRAEWCGFRASWRTVGASATRARRARRHDARAVRSANRVRARHPCGAGVGSKRDGSSTGNSGFTPERATRHRVTDRDAKSAPGPGS